MSETAPDTYRARFQTTRGDFVLQVNRDWAPRGADRFHELVTQGHFDGVRFFRVLKGFVAQFGINGDPAVAAKWRDATFPDDPVKEGNSRGRITFATAGPDSRTTQVFINLADNASLDGMGFSAFGEVVEGMDVVDGLYGDYGEGAPSGRGPNQSRVQSEGNAYLERDFPKLDHVEKASVED